MITSNLYLYFNSLIVNLSGERVYINLNIILKKIKTCCKSDF